MQESDLPPPRHEPGDLGVNLIWIGVPAVVLGILVLSWLVLALYPGDTVDRTMSLPLPHFPAPELQADPVRDMDQLRAAQLAQLNGLGWVDARARIAHVPIDAALKQVASEGIADWPANPDDADAR